MVRSRGSPKSPFPDLSLLLLGPNPIMMRHNDVVIISNLVVSCLGLTDRCSLVCLDGGHSLLIAFFLCVRWVLNKEQWYSFFMFFCSCFDVLCFCSHNACTVARPQIGMRDDMRLHGPHWEGTLPAFDLPCWIEGPTISAMCDEWREAAKGCFFCLFLACV